MIPHLMVRHTSPNKQNKYICFIPLLYNEPRHNQCEPACSENLQSSNEKRRREIQKSSVWPSLKELSIVLPAETKNGLIRIENWFFYDHSMNFKGADQTMANFSCWQKRTNESRRKHRGKPYNQGYWWRIVGIQIAFVTFSVCVRRSHHFSSAAVNEHKRTVTLKDPQLRR